MHFKTYVGYQQILSPDIKKLYHDKISQFLFQALMLCLIPCQENVETVVMSDFYFENDFVCDVYGYFDQLRVYVLSWIICVLPCLLLQSLRQ